MTSEETAGCDSACLPDFPSFAVDRPPSLDSAYIASACDLAGWPCPSSFQSLRRRMRISAKNRKKRKKRGRHVRRSRMLVADAAVSETISKSSRRHSRVVQLGIKEEGRVPSSCGVQLSSSCCGDFFVQLLRREALKR